MAKVVEDDKREVESLLAQNKNESREIRTKKWKAGVDQVPEGGTDSIHDPRDAPARDWHLFALSRVPAESGIMSHARSRRSGRDGNVICRDRR